MRYQRGGSYNQLSYYNGIKPLASDSNKTLHGRINSDKLNMTMQIGPTKGEVLDLKGQDMTLKGIFEDLGELKRMTTVSENDVALGVGDDMWNTSRNTIIKKNVASDILAPSADATHLHIARVRI